MGSRGSREGGHVHVLITFDVPGVGQMEAEFMMAGKELDSICIVRNPI